MTDRIHKIVRTIVPESIRPKFRKAYNLYKHGTTDFFKGVDIEISTVCNRRCFYCPNSVTDRSLPENNKIMETSTFKNVIDQLSELDFNGRVSPILYNEPLLDNRLYELMKYAKDKLPNASTVIYTNGDLLTLRKYVELEDVVDLFIITQHQDKRSSTLESLFHHLKIPLYYLQKEEEWCYKKIQFRYFPNKGGLSSRAGLIKFKKTYKYPKKGCYIYSGRYGLEIDYMGNVLLCCEDYLSTVVFGNVKEERIMDIWNKPSFKNIRKRIRAGELPLEICQRCSFGEREDLVGVE